MLPLIEQEKMCLYKKYYSVFGLPFDERFS